jgi:hypothetical protein
MTDLLFCDDAEQSPNWLLLYRAMAVRITCPMYPADVAAAEFMFQSFPPPVGSHGIGRKWRIWPLQQLKHIRLKSK